MLLCVGSLSVISGATIAPALPGIEGHFSQSPHAPLLARLVLTAPALAIAIMAPIVGIMIDRTGRRGLLLFATFIFGVVGMSGLLLNDIYALIGSRIILGFTVAATMTICAALIGDYYAGEDRARLFGIQTAVQGIAGLVFTVLGGMLAEIDWRTTFALYTFAFLIFPGVYKFLPEPERNVPLQKNDEQKPSDPVDGWTSQGVVPKERQKHREISARNIMLGLFVVAFFNSACFFLLPTQIPFLLRQLGERSPTMAGLAIGITTISMTISSLSYGKIRRNFDGGQIFIFALWVMASGFVIVGLANHAVFVFVGTAIIGCGMGMFTPNLILAIMATATEKNRGRVASGMTSSLFLGQFISPIIIHPLLTAVGTSYAFISVAMGLLFLSGIMTTIYIIRK
tara:strand:+ start:5101 stop:6294 length:1194 start_codon:yes stop_codon:yes gene_type:complete